MMSPGGGKPCITGNWCSHQAESNYPDLAAGPHHLMCGTAPQVYPDRHQAVYVNSTQGLL